MFGSDVSQTAKHAMVPPDKTSLFVREIHTEHRSRVEALNL